MDLSTLRALVPGLPHEHASPSPFRLAAALGPRELEAHPQQAILTACRLPRVREPRPQRSARNAHAQLRASREQVLGFGRPLHESLPVVALKIGRIATARPAARPAARPRGPYPRCVDRVNPAPCALFPSYRALSAHALLVSLAAVYSIRWVIDRVRLALGAVGVARCVQGLSPTARGTPAGGRRAKAAARARAQPPRLSPRHRRRLPPVRDRQRQGSRRRRRGRRLPTLDRGRRLYRQPENDARGGPAHQRQQIGPPKHRGAQRGAVLLLGRHRRFRLRFLLSLIVRAVGAAPRRGLPRSRPRGGAPIQRENDVFAPEHAVQEAVQGAVFGRGGVTAAAVAAAAAAAVSGVCREEVVQHTAGDLDGVSRAAVEDTAVGVPPQIVHLAGRGRALAVTGFKGEARGSLKRGRKGC